MKKTQFFLLTTALLTLLGCSHHPGEVSIQGRFDNIEQGEFYIYSSDQGLDRVDTLHIQGGRFQYSLPLEGAATLHILYPNYSQLTLFAEPGQDITVKGDAQNLSQVQVSGSQDNKLYTEFRLESLQKSADSTRLIARRYALQNPTLAVSRYLFTQYILLSSQAPERQVTQVFDSLCRACPQDAGLSRLKPLVRARLLLQPGKPLPDFTLRTRRNVYTHAAGRTIRRADYRGQYLLIAFWAAWKGGSQSAIFRSRRLQKDMQAHQRRLQLISYSLDASDAQLRLLEDRDSIDFPSYCDRQGFDSPLVQQWGIREVPYFILAGPDQRIIASGADWMHDIDPHTRALTR